VRPETMVVIPAFNEALNIRGVAEAIAAEGLPVLVVNDGSTDATAAEAEAGGAEVISLETNLGKGAALRRGLEHARESGFELVAVLDGDGQHDPGEIRKLLDVLNSEQSDMVIGSRMHDIKDMPRLRRFINRLMSRIVSWLARTRIRDTQSGFRVFRTAVLNDITLHTRHFEIESEMIIRTGRRGFKITETPIRTIYGTGEHSSIRPVVDTARFLLLVFRCLILG
jgi:glycosyltransferase involved in cell wall biosynthesis